MHSVVAAKPVLSREIAGVARQRVVDPDDQRRGVQRLEVRHGSAVCRRGQTAVSMGSGQRRPCLRVCHDADGHRLAGAPQPDREF